MHVAYIVACYPRPSEAFLFREIRDLARQGYRVTVCALGTGGPGPRPLARPLPGVSVIYRPRVLSKNGLVPLILLCLYCPVGVICLLAYLCVLAGSSLSWWWALLRNLHAVAFFAWWARQHHIDLVHGYFLNLPAVLAMAVAAASGQPFTLAGHARDVFVERGPVRLLARHAKWVVLCHLDAAEHVRCSIPPDTRRRVHVVHHGLDLGEWSDHSETNVGHGDGRPMVLAVGRLVEKKGLAVLIRAGVLLGERSVAFRLRLVGDGPLADQLRGLACRLGLADHVMFDGWREEQEMPDVFAAATVLVVPSIVAADGDRDGIPNVVLEAAASRVPVVASRLPGLSEVIEDGVTGILVEPGSSRALADALQRVLGDRQLGDRLAGNAYRRVRESFDIQRSVRALGQLFQKVGHGVGG